MSQLEDGIAEGDSETWRLLKLHDTIGVILEKPYRNSQGFRESNILHFVFSDRRKIHIHKSAEAECESTDENQSQSS